ncbi:UDP-N-acetylglucosamine--LPS N-acetylglucosamine transferase [uncultured Litoreibacter sp.]|uniref:UDP-N-acetylglucosamine--LPS N-acetylglucosamine transferase n=1 Tax=uncultured Litoreibacter sp. TaxID=1392394 RepID=UPI00343F5AE2
MCEILAVSSGGGHWQQLQLLSKAFDGKKVVYACSSDVGDASIIRLPDCNMRTPWRLIITAIAAWKLVRQINPDTVVSTGAAPGVLVLITAKLHRRRTVWVDSIANTERMSLSGRLARSFSDLWVTQWPQVSHRSGAVYLGAII